MRQLRTHILFRFFWVMLSVHILNFSIDTPDRLPNNVPEDLNVNDIESVLELVLEDVLQIPDAVQEHDEQDTEEGYSLEIKKILSFAHFEELLSFKHFCFCYIEKCKLVSYFFIPDFFSEVFIPPPQA
jgi:hypothetical protein